MSTRDSDQTGGTSRVPRLSAAVLALAVAVAAVVAIALFAGGAGDGELPVPQERTAAGPPSVDNGPAPPAAPPRERGATTTTAPEPTPPAEEPARPAVPLRRLVGGRLFVRMNGTSPSRGFLARVRRGEVGGVVLFAPNIRSRSQVRRLVRRLAATARAGKVPAPLIAIDQEGGIVKRLRSAPPFRSAPQIGATGSSRVARAEGLATGRSLRGIRVDIDFAPVVDVPASSSSFIASRAFSRDPRRVTRLGGAFAGGLQSRGVAATLKHFPGLGSAPANTDFATAVVQAPRSRLARELRPYRGTRAALVMLATAVYPAYQRGTPAAFSRRIVTSLLRRKLRFGGVIVTDDLETPAVRAYTSPSEGAVRSLRAGADMALVVGSEAGGRRAYAHMLRAARAGRLKRSALEASHARVEALRERLRRR